MDKDEILERSRKEHKDRDFVEDEALSKANGIALTVGVILCALLSILHSFFRDGADPGVWTVMFGILSTVMLVKFARLRRRHELVAGLLYLVCAIVFFLGYLLDLLGVLRWTRA